ncbi:MAG: type II toxin-antitoxin system HicA family toxin [Richelia sp. RM2_1_2]|nr:type II toxin-antitoxin system HicA family toxin [Richelia sp. SM2_1_7]NJM23422.1 type II toxin-antitoxin system HicA family toxin [Richelia sp. SM1_7_0]NJN11093.1 type II toxin-antitoxin system HicA family toxin [Richelia sp. RM1_1_1]NJO29894.1 type II toxin-antitoxin system HicA family toxin [Richelia sp. SL_2_1]NJO61978.1 type II toxin-antitoxin system HicA family toxin [Richelia sp. RM2_1_2]
MKAVSGKTMCKILEKQGWELKRITGSHHIYSKEGIDEIISVPVHSNRDLPIGTLKSIMKDAELEEEDLS